MGLDFDAMEYCRNVKLQQTRPPYACPVHKCDKNYKTVVGLQYHLINYDHDNPQPLTPILTPNRKKARSRGTHQTSTKMPKGSIVSGSGTDEQNGSVSSNNNTVANPESLVTFNEDEQTVQFNIDGKSIRLGIDEPLPFIEEDEYEDLAVRGLILNPNAPPVEENAVWARVAVPEAKYREIEDYNVPDAPPRPLAYYRFIEKSPEELDGEIEYDVDEEDTIWLEMMNEQRESSGLSNVSIDTMELLMDRLEKESFFQAAANGTGTGAEVDDDAVCCICMDGECQNTNVILFCDMCNLAVHQDCYGVPYIPEGQWLCRRCLQSPSTPVNCVLCPNSGGAFKQTDQGQWAHVVCALWIPEVRFANTVFLEPIDSIETIPAARWRLTCYVCKEKGLGACIQCQRTSCYAAFHVTCAQQAGLYMTMDTVKDGSSHNDSVHVQKYAYCHAHTPADAKLKTNQKEVEDTRHKMKEARKALAKKRTSAPIVLIPTIPTDRVQEIASMVHMQKKTQFLDRLIAYWTLKRQHRNGVPLLRRLQSQGNHHSVIHRNGIEGSPDTSELYKQLKYWQCLRQDLERARLLCELVRKREKLKAAYVKICEQVVMRQLNPLESVLSKLLDALEAKDTSEIFCEPVDTKEVPDYLDIVKHPIDLGTMRKRLKQAEYRNLDHLEADFDLMIQNCLAYNNKDTVFYRAGIRMRDQAAPLFLHARKELEREGLVDNSYNRDQPDHVELEIEEELKQLLEAPACEETLQKLLILADKSQVLKNPSDRTKKIKQIRLEISRMRKMIQKSRIIARNSSKCTHSQTEEDEDEDGDASIQEHIKMQHSLSKRTRRPTNTNNNAMIVGDDNEDGNQKEVVAMTQTPPSSPVKSLNNSASPVGVNRRTAVLFTRKAQAALKRPSDAKTPIKEESTMLNVNAHVTTTTMGVMSNSSNASTNAAAAMAATLNSNTLKFNNKLNVSGMNALTSLGVSLGMNSAVLSVNNKSPKRNSRHKRLFEIRNHSSPMLPKKSPNTTLSSASLVAPSEMSYDRIPDSFRVYRANNERDVSDSDDDDLSDDVSGSPCSSCSGFSGSGSGTYDTSDEDDDDDDDENDNDNDNNGAADQPDVDDEEDDDDNDNDEADPDADKDDEEDQIDNSLATDGNGKAMSCSDADSGSESGSDVEMANVDTNVNNSNTNTEAAVYTDAKSGTTHPFKSSETRSRNASRTKQKGKSMLTSVNALSPMIGTAADESAKNCTRASQKHMNARAATPISASSPVSLNNERGKKSATLNSKMNNGRYLNVTTTMLMSPDTNNGIAIATVTGSGTATASDNSSMLLKPPLEPLQLVWAKCRGYPWYPALILDPKTPKGFVYNGVPLPAPPPDVLVLRKNYSEDEVFLVLFFDVKRTWQWLPANKLEILGIDKELDQLKLVESRKPAERKAVKKAYQDALHYQSQVSDLEGQGPDPIM